VCRQFVGRTIRKHRTSTHGNPWTRRIDAPQGHNPKATTKHNQYYRFRGFAPTIDGDLMLLNANAVFLPAKREMQGDFAKMQGDPN
jgi:hypothetical protein